MPTFITIIQYCKGQDQAEQTSTQTGRGRFRSHLRAINTDTPQHKGSRAKECGSNEDRRRGEHGGQCPHSYNCGYETDAFTAAHVRSRFSHGEALTRVIRSWVYRWSAWYDRLASVGHHEDICSDRAWIATSPALFRGILPPVLTAGIVFESLGYMRMSVAIFRSHAILASCHYGLKVLLDRRLESASQC